MSFNVTVVPVAAVPVTDDNKEALVSMITNMYNSEGCGVCEKEGAEVFWFSPYSRCAHARCFKIIEPATSTLYLTIDDLFNGAKHGEHNDAHIKAIKAVRSACGSDTIMSYLEKNGLDALKNLFNTVGVKAVKQYAYASKSRY